MKRARNPKRTSSQYSCTKTFVSPESGSFTTGRRVRTRDHYHQRDTLAHRTTEHAAKGVIGRARGYREDWIRGERARVYTITRHNVESVQVSEYRGGHEEIVCPSDPFRVIFNRDRDGMVGWTEEGRKEGGGEERGEEKRLELVENERKRFTHVLKVRRIQARCVSSVDASRRAGLLELLSKSLHSALVMRYFLPPLTRYFPPTSTSPIDFSPILQNFLAHRFFSTFSFTLSCLDRSTIDQRTTNVRSIYRTGSVKQIFRAGGGGRKIKARKAGKMYAGRSATAHWSVNADKSYAIPIDRLAPTIITTIEPTINAIGNGINSSLASGTLFISRSRSFFTPLCETIVRNALSHLCRKVETAATVRTPAQRR